MLFHAFSTMSLNRESVHENILTPIFFNNPCSFNTMVHGKQQQQHCMGFLCGFRMLLYLGGVHHDPVGLIQHLDVVVPHDELRRLYFTANKMFIF